MDRATPPTPGSPAAERLEDLGCFTRAVDDILRERRRLTREGVASTPTTLRLLAALEELDEYKVDAKRDRLVRAAALIVSTLDSLAQ